jgi:CRP-like cAMP-binding protein
MARLFRRDAKIEALRRAPLFEGLSRADLNALARASEDLEAPAGEVLCGEGQLAREFFVIVEGEVDVTRGGTYVTTLGTGDFFGEIALLERCRRTATVTTTTPLRYFVLTRRAFLDLLDSNPNVDRRVLRALARRVLATSDAVGVEDAPAREGRTGP